MNKAASIAIFLVGAAVGSAATWQYVKNKYEQIAQEEIDSVKEKFSQRETIVTNVYNTPASTEDTDVRSKAEQAKEKPDIMKYAAKLRETGYTNYAGEHIPDNKENTEPMEKPYVIPPEDFGEIDDYEAISITYYADQILTDDNDDPIDDVEAIVGFDALTHFGEYEDDSVFVRNDRLKCDYEILRDQRKYSDVVNRKPYEVDE